MSYYRSSSIITSLAILVLSSSLIWTAPLSLTHRIPTKNNNTPSLTYPFRYAAQAVQQRNITTLVRDQLKPSYDNHDDNYHPNNDDNNDDEDNTVHKLTNHHENENSSSDRLTAHVVVLTSLSGVYVWWPILFGGDDSLHLLLSQEDVPRFHDVAGDEHGNIYLTAPHERTVYRIQYSDGWWISNVSNHSVMNSIRHEMPLFLNIHHVPSILYVYGHSDIQIIDLLERPRTRGSAPFMKRLRELSPNLRISDMIIDQLTSDGYIIGDSYGWCTIIRCSLAVSECVFLFKIPSSFDNRPYPCTATIDFTTKIMYINLEEKILGVHLNAQNNFDRRFILAEKSGARSTLGYDDIITHNQTVLYTDVLRPLLHICRSAGSIPCLNMSLTFASPHRTILPLRLSIIQAPKFRPPMFDHDDEHERPIDSFESDRSSTSHVSINETSTLSALITDSKSRQSPIALQTTWNLLWMLFLGVCIGLILAGISFTIYFIKWNKIRSRFTATSRTCSSVQRTKTTQSPLLPKSHMMNEYSRNKTSPSSSSDFASDHSLQQTKGSSRTSSSVYTTITTSSSSYEPDTIL
jgi:hypothetical protein